MKSWNLPLLCKCRSLSHRYQIHHHHQSRCLWYTDVHSFHFLTPQSLKRHNWHIQFIYFFLFTYSSPDITTPWFATLQTEVLLMFILDKQMQVSGWRWETLSKTGDTRNWKQSEDLNLVWAKKQSRQGSVLPQKTDFYPSFLEDNSSKLLWGRQHFNNWIGFRSNFSLL